MRQITSALLVAAASLGIIATGVACGQSEEPRRVTVSESFLDTSSAVDLESLLAVGPDVFVGRVLNTRDFTNEIPASWDRSYIPEDAGKTPDPKDAHREGVNPPVLSAYEVLVERVISGSVVPGQRITLLQQGGWLKGVAYQPAEDPLVRPGATMLFFAGPFGSEQDGGVYWLTPPWGRFELSGKDTIAAAAWGDELPVPALLRGKKLDDVELLIRAAAARARDGVPPPAPVSPPAR